MPDPTPSKPSSRWQRLRLYLTIIAPIILLILILMFFKDLREVYRQANAQNIALAALFFFLGSLLISLRYWIILDRSLPFSRLFRSDGLAFLAVQFVLIPVQAIRVASISLTSRVESGWASAKAVLDFMLNIFMRLLAAVIVILLLSSNSVGLRVGLPAATLIGMTLLLIWLYRRPEFVRSGMVGFLNQLPFVKKDTVETFAAGLAKALQTVRGGQLAAAWLISLATWALFALMYYEGVLALNLDLNWDKALTIIFLALVLSPPSGPFMIVVQQVVVSAGLLMLGYISHESAIGYSLLMQGVQFFLWLLLAIWAVLTTQIRLRDMLKMTEQERSG